MWPFKKKLSFIRITVHQLNGIGENKKATLKFLKTYFKGCGNYEQVHFLVTSLNESSHRRALHITGEIPIRKAEQIIKNRTKLGISAEVYSVRGHIGSYTEDQIHPYTKNRLPWVTAK
jgi:hypothetical protein